MKMATLYRAARTACLLMGLLFLYPLPARAHEVLGPVAVNSILKSIGQARQTLASDLPAQQKEKAVLEIGFQGHTLMKLINAEIQEHGNGQQGLIDLAIRRSRQMDVEIAFSEKKKVYLYDFLEFEEYLRLAPQGEYAAEAKFALLERSFYEHTGGEKDPARMEEQLNQKKKFLADYPDFNRRADLELLLTLDYYELYVIHLQREETEKAQQYRQELLKKCRYIVETFPDTAAAEVSRNLLFQLEL